MMNSAVLILAVCRTPVTYELGKMTLLSMSSRSQWTERPPGVREVMGSINVGDSDFSLSYARVMLNISSFTINIKWETELEIERLKRLNAELADLGNNAISRVMWDE